MNFYMPTKIFYGKKAMSEATESIKSLGTKALIVTGRGSAQKSGALDATTDLLKQLNIKYTIYSEIEENPTLSSVEKGANLCASEKCDFVIGIGGGSPIDAAKAIAILRGSNLKIDEIYQAEKYSAVLPLMAVPITSGTGTEATQYSVLTDTIKKKKAGLNSPLAFPTIAILNPEFTYSLPNSVTINTSIDALSHLLEGLFSNKRNPLTYPLIHKGIKLILDNLIGALKDPAKYEHRDALMQASLYGGIVIAHSGTTLQHSIGYPLTTKFGTPHGMANGIVMKEMINLYFPTIEQEMNDLFAYLNITLEEFFAWLDNFDLVLEERLDDETIAKMTSETMKSSNMASNPLEVSADKVEELYRKISL